MSAALLSRFHSHKPAARKTRGGLKFEVQLFKVVWRQAGLISAPLRRPSHSEGDRHLCGQSHFLEVHDGARQRPWQRRWCTSGMRGARWFCRINSRQPDPAKLTSLFLSWQSIMLDSRKTALSARYNIGVHSLVRSVSVKLPSFGRNDAGTWCVCRSFFDQPMGHPAFAVA
jgi:hypothetical protein